MADVTEELKQLNMNATELLSKYDGVFSKIDTKSQEILLAIAQKSAEGLSAITTLLENGTVTTAENALKLEGKTLDEVAQYIADNQPEPVSTVSKFDIFNDGSAVALYPFDGNANDTGGNYNDTWSGTEAYDVGKFGNSADTSNGSPVSSAKLIPSSADFTISLWLSPKVNNGDTYKDFFCQGSPDFFIGFGVSNDIRITNYPSLSNSLIPAGKFTHFVFTVSGGGVTGTAYVNGVQQSTANLSSSISGTSYSDNFTLGRQYGGLGEQFNGLIDQVRIFNRALTADEVTTLYNEGA